MQCRAILFDLDGVLVDSRECIELIWHAWAAERGLDPADFLRVAHGRRIAETLRLVAPQLDASVEAAVLDAMEEVETRGLRATPGAAALLRQLSEAQRAIVTSGSRAVATLRLRTAGLPIPDVFVTAGDVKQGKPYPEGYLMAAGRLGVALRRVSRSPASGDNGRDRGPSVSHPSRRARAGQRVHAEPGRGGVAVLVRGAVGSAARRRAGRYRPCQGGPSPPRRAHAG